MLADLKCNLSVIRQDVSDLTLALHRYTYCPTRIIYNYDNNVCNGTKFFVSITNFVMNVTILKLLFDLPLIQLV